MKANIFYTTSYERHIKSDPRQNLTTRYHHYSTVAMYTYQPGFTIQCYHKPKPNPNYKKGTKSRTRKPNSTIVAANRPNGRRIAATIVGLGFLDTALYLNQY